MKVVGATSGRTRSAMQGDRQMCLAAGRDGYRFKLIRAADLVAMQSCSIEVSTGEG
jgi:hypothetical protein